MADATFCIAARIYAAWVTFSGWRHEEYDFGGTNPCSEILL